MEQNFNRRIETDLDLNGPNLAVSSQPSDATVANGASQTFSVTASASFPGNSNPDNEGTLTYQWYEVDGGNTTNVVLGQLKRDINSNNKKSKKGGSKKKSHKKNKRKSSKHTRKH